MDETVFHITHWKSGSQWVGGVLLEAAPERAVRVASDFSNIRADRLRPGGIYTPVYLPVHGFREFVGETPGRPFIVIRDLRDTLVSWYFSVKHSHGTGDANVAGTVLSYRERFNQCSKEEGLLITLRERLQPMAQIQSSWAAAGVPLFRYEDMIVDEQDAFRKIFAVCAIEMDDAQRHAVVEKHSFKKRAGRAPGEEDVGSHYRKGIAGDWRNHFTDRIIDEFKERFGAVLVDVGYEPSANW